MPSTARTPRQPLRRDSWPPTQMRLRHSIEAEDTAMDAAQNEDMSFDDDPINFFLTPTPLLDDGDTDEEDDTYMDMDLDNMAFDAGIENPHQPQPAIRSISPSDLTGPSRPPSSPPKTLPLFTRSPTPPKSWSGPRSPPSRNSPEALTPRTEPDDDDDEDYVRFTPHGMSFGLPPFNLDHNFGSSKSRGKARKAAAARAKRQAVDEDDRVGMMMMARGPATTGALLSPPGPFHVGRPPLPTPSTRGRSTTVVGRPPLLAQRPRSWSGATGYSSSSSGRLSPRAWREPSPDVWSIEEQPEEELLSEVGDGSVADMEVDAAYGKEAAGDKPGKKVRFVLPVTEEIP